MPSPNPSYEVIANKISSLKTAYPSLRAKSDDYVFSALCIKANLYKNPALILTENDFDNMIVDGQYDGGVDILLTDPNSENSDLIIAQSKFYSSISKEDVLNAFTKMALFYKNMVQGHYEVVNEKVQGRFLTLNAELGDESKIHFVFYTSALQARINTKNIEKKFRELFVDSSKFEVSIYFAADIVEEIKELDSRSPVVESGKINIDLANNYLLYGDDAAIVNMSAFSLKTLYAQHGTNLLSQNLRYHISGGTVDREIKKTIAEDSNSFWYKNNGITIICDDFQIDGKEVHLKNFSVINGGQTTYVIHKSHDVCEDSDFYLPCKIIKTIGETKEEKDTFCLEIAKATNSQKPIKDVDLKSNTPEQRQFAEAMREVGIFYQTKRGEKIPINYHEDYLNSSLTDIAKLGLSAIFQMPCTSRNKNKILYQSPYYDIIFNSNQIQISKLCKELLYIDYYFNQTFLKKFDRENKQMPDANMRIAFAHNARTICIAFTAFASRYYQANLKTKDLQIIFSAADSESENILDSLTNVLSKLDNISYFLPPALFAQKDNYDIILEQLFTTIINTGITSFSMALRYDTTLTPTNFLKKDKYYYSILKDHWATISNDITRILTPVME